MENLRIGIVGAGVIGTEYLKLILDGKIQNTTVSAICNATDKRFSYLKSIVPDNVRFFTNVDEMLNQNILDGLIITTPHYDHPPIAIKAFKRGLHVLIDKPAGVYTKQVRKMNDEALKSGKVFGIIYNQRTNTLYSKARELIKSGDLGDLKRISWINTSSYRSQSYYDSNKWRATWSGEGGGVLLNQSSHPIDLWQWICGMPQKIRAFMGYGKYHNIEVEDDITAYMEYENGATGVFITSTGETPGTNRLEIIGDMGKIIIENQKIDYFKLKVSERKFNKEYKGGMGEPEFNKVDLSVVNSEPGHEAILNNWISGILEGKPLLSPGIEGIKGLEISNAIYLSDWINDMVTLPVDEDLYYTKLEEKIKQSL